MGSCLSMGVTLLLRLSCLVMMWLHCWMTGHTSNLLKLSYMWLPVLTPMWQNWCCNCMWIRYTFLHMCTVLALRHPFPLHLRLCCHATFVRGQILYAFACICCHRESVMHWLRCQPQLSVQHWCLPVWSCISTTHLSLVFCSYANTQDSKIPLPSKEKHVILHGYPIEFDVDHCVIHIVNMVLGPRVDLAAHSTDMLPPAKLGRFDWKGWKGKQARKDDNSKYDDDDDAQW